MNLLAQTPQYLCDTQKNSLCTGCAVLPGAGRLLLLPEIHTEL